MQSLDQSRANDECWICGTPSRKPFYFDCSHCDVTWRERDRSWTLAIERKRLDEAEKSLARVYQVTLIDFTKPDAPNHP